MTPEIVAGIVAFLLALIGGVAGWVRVDQHGAARERRRRVEEENDALRKRVSTAPASVGEASEILRRRLARLADRSRRLRENGRLERVPQAKPGRGDGPDPAA